MPPAAAHKVRGVSPRPAWMQIAALRVTVNLPATCCPSPPNATSCHLAACAMPGPPPHKAPRLPPRAGISHNQSRFKAAADRCLASFTRLFGSSPLVERPLPTDYGSPPSCHLGFGLDCMYLADH